MKRDWKKENLQWARGLSTVDTESLELDRDYHALVGEIEDKELYEICKARVCLLDAYIQYRDDIQNSVSPRPENPIDVWIEENC